MTNCTFKNHSTEGFQCFQLFHIPLVILHHVVPSQSCYSKSQSTVGYLSTTSYSMAYIDCLAATTSPTRPSCSLAGCQGRCLTNLKWLGIKGSEACNHLIQFWPFRRHPRHTSSQHLHTQNTIKPFECPSELEPSLQSLVRQSKPRPAVRSGPGMKGLETTEAKLSLSPSSLSKRASGHGLRRCFKNSR